MKRTLAYSLFLALAVSAVAQTPTVTEQPATKPASTNAKPAAPAKTTNGKPSPATAKTGSTSQKTASVVAKPAVVAVQPVTAKPGAVSTTVKTNPTAAAKAVPATAATKTAAVAAPKTNSTAAVKPVAVPVVKPAANVAKPVAGAKPTAMPAPATPHPVAVPVAAAAGQPKGAVVAVKGPAKAEPNGKSPFSKKEAPVAGVKPGPTTTVAVKDNKGVSVKKPEPKKISAAGRRDPFVSPVVNMGAVGSGCSSGKRCLTIDQIALKGVVKSDNGMIAVVVNAMDKAYFLRENDPVFNGYVVKITGDSIVFKETFHDKLGKPLTRDVTKTISRPVA
jgi:hypothetical protein